MSEDVPIALLERAGKMTINKDAVVRHKKAHTKRPRSFRLFVLAVVLFFSVFVGGTQPAEALCLHKCSKPFSLGVSLNLPQWAQRIIKQAEELKFLADIIKVAMWINEKISKFMNWFVNKFDILIGLLHIDKTLETKIDQLKHEDTKAAVAESTQASMEAKTAAEIQPNDAATVLCNTVKSRQAQAVMLQFVEICAQEATEALMGAFRGVGVDGTGPQRAAMGRLLQCPPSTLDAFSTYPRTLSNKDNASSECITSGFEDADIMARIIAGEDAVLEMPSLEPYTVKDSSGNDVTVRVPTPAEGLLGGTLPDGNEWAGDLDSYKAQQKWVAGFHYCFISAGSRPAPPAGNALSRPDGIIAMHEWGMCAAIQSSYIHECAKMLCNNTRPNDADDFEKQVGATTMAACNAAREIGVDVPWGCKKPLTRYQTEYLARQVCFTDKRAILGGAAGGASAFNITFQNDFCAATMGRWKDQRNKEMANFLRGQRGAQSLKDCWPKVDIKPVISSSTGN